MTQNKIALVLRFSSLGDLVLCTAFCEKLSSLKKHESIFFVTYQQYSSLLESFPTPVKIWKINRWSLIKSFFQGMKFSRRFPASDLEIFDLQGNLRALAFRAGLKLSHVLAFRGKVTVQKTPRKSWLRNKSVWLKKDFLGSRFIFEEHQKLLGEDKFFKPQLKVTSSVSKQGILLAPDSQHWKKKIPEDMCFEILEKIFKESTETVTLVGSSQHLNESKLRELSQKYPQRLKNLLDQTKIEELPSIASSHRICICGNSAWLHICEAVGTPVMSFAGPIIKGFGFSPWKKESVELSLELPCRPCTKHGGGPCVLQGSNYHACVRLVDWRSKLAQILGNHL